MFTDIKQKIDTEIVRRIISYAAFDASVEGVTKIIEQYQNAQNLNFYAWIENDVVLGICSYEVHKTKVEIHLISVDEHARSRGVGGNMTTALQDKYVMLLEAETDDDAVVFYRKVGFETTEFTHEKRGKRHYCFLEP
ncbi:MAG: GNAT family N-acetyltransferase [Defluviitaleaceae bacterium]|nr:GNAT family N-acetyltransferase [Defluviitaleaceae bacterium]